MVKRANALLEALRWMAKAFPDRSDIFHEDLAWAYVSALRKAGGAPTKAADFVSALRFATHVMGINSGHLIVSRRVAGLSEQMVAGKRFTQQAKVIAVDQMRFLHQLLDSQELCPCDRAVCAYLLIAVYGRCRHSDLACVHDAVADSGEEGGCLEIRTGTHKTGRTAQKKAMLLPILIPAKGVTGTVWMYNAAKAFNAIGLTLDGTINGPSVLFRAVRARSHVQRGHGYDAWTPQIAFQSGADRRFVKPFCEEYMSELVCQVWAVQGRQELSRKAHECSGVKLCYLRQGLGDWPSEAVGKGHH